MKPLLAAIRFLTVLPIPGTWGTTQEDLAASVPFFPLTGLLLGAVAAGLAWAIAPYAPPLLLAAMVIVVLMSFSGCLHLDGLADTADGFLSSRSRERILEIMKDSHTGSMGVVAIASVLLVKFAALASLPTSLLCPAVLLMPLAGRTAIVVEMALLPYARSSGLGIVFYRRRPRWAALWAVALWALVAYGVLGLRGLTVWGTSMAAALGLCVYAYRKIGGATGDTLGAMCELIEVVPALVLALGPQSGVR